MIYSKVHAFGLFELTGVLAHFVCQICWRKRRFESFELKGPERDDLETFKPDEVYLGRIFGFVEIFEGDLGLEVVKSIMRYFFEKIELASILFDHIIPLPNH